MNKEDLRRLIETIDKELYKDWLNSEGCFLDHADKVILKCYLEDETLTNAINALNISSDEAFEMLKEATKKIHEQEDKFGEWLLKLFFRRSTSWVLSLPLNEVSFLSGGLLDALESFGVPNLKELLNKYAAVDIEKKLGYDLYYEFKVHIEYYQLSSYLRSTNN